MGAGGEAQLGNMIVAAAFGALEARLEAELPRDCSCRDQVLAALGEMRRVAERAAKTGSMLVLVNESARAYCQRVLHALRLASEGLLGGECGSRVVELIRFVEACIQGMINHDSNGK